MPRVRFAAFVLMFALNSAPLPGQVFDNVAPGPRTTPARLVALYQSMLDAIVRVDTVALSLALDPTYTWTPGGEGRVYDRAERFAHMVASSDHLDSLFVRHCRVTMHGTAAVGNCRVAERGDFGSGSEHVEIQSTVVFVKDRARWRIATTQTFALPDSTK